MQGRCAGLKLFNQLTAYLITRSAGNVASKYAKVRSGASGGSEGESPEVRQLAILINACAFDQKQQRADLPLNFHPAAIRASAGFTPWGAGGATCDRLSWSGLRSRSHVAERLAA